jgi:hypothetical protein
MKQKTRSWSAAELKLLKDPKLTNAQIAERTKRTMSAVEHQRRGLPAAMASATTPDHKDPSGYWKDQFVKANREIVTLQKRDTAIRVLVEEIEALVPTTYSPAPAVTTRRGTGKGQPQTAHLILSDSHTGQHVSPDQTLGLGSYGPLQFLRRLKYVEDSVLSICSEHVTTQIDELVIAVLGDMIHGNLQHSNEAAHIMPIVDQVVVTAHALAQFIRNVAPHFPKVRIKSVVGNHSRWGDQRKMPTVNRYSNFDTLVYEIARGLLRDIKNVDWHIDEQPFAFYRVYDYTILAVHGDHLRGGDKALGIPAHAIGREISFNAQVFPTSHLGKTPNYYLVGHLHRPMELPHANGDVLYNGGFPGVDNYSFASKLVPSAPSQKLFLIHPANGRSATWNLSISRGDVRYGDVVPYDIPESSLKRLVAHE